MYRFGEHHCLGSDDLRDSTSAQARADDRGRPSLLEFDEVLFFRRITEKGRLRTTVAFGLHFPNRVLEEMRLVAAFAFEGGWI